jgi:DNA topoisomerase-1
MSAFAAALPAIRKRVAKDLNLPGIPRQKVLATVVRLLEKTGIRVGNEEYAKANDSYGLTTMKDGHVKVRGRKLTFHFRGKSGLKHDVELTDPKLSRIVYECQCIPGEELFQYIDAEGRRRRIRSEDVNEYLHQIAGERFTAKDFRTWVGSCQMTLELERIGPADTEADAKTNIVTAIKEVARRLGNRPATCRNYYVHPVLLDAYTNGTLIEAIKKVSGAASQHTLRREELCLVSLISAPPNAKAA